MAEDYLSYSEENLLAQLEEAPYKNGYFTVRFYADSNQKPSVKRTDRVLAFFYYPSGGTLRDKDFNLVWYEAKFDTYRGFRPPGGPWRDDSRRNERER